MILLRFQVCSQMIEFRYHFPVAPFSLKAMCIDEDPQLWPKILLLTFAGLRAKL